MEYGTSPTRRKYECNYKCPCASRLRTGNAGSGEEPKDCGLRASQVIRSRRRFQASKTMVHAKYLLPYGRHAQHFNNKVPPPQDEGQAVVPANLKSRRLY